MMKNFLNNRVTYYNVKLELSFLRKSVRIKVKCKVLYYVDIDTVSAFL